MPKVGGPGGDNISGDRYTLDLGVEPDLGNLLQNLQVANDLLEAVEEKFHSISDVVGSTTQRLSQATRQTQLLASETQRLQNSYSLMAQSSFTLANMGQMAGGMGMMPGMGMGMMPGMGMIPGQMAFGGIPPAAEVAETFGGGGAAYAGAREDIPEFEPPPPPPPGFPLSVRAAALEQITEKFTGGKAQSPLGIAINKFRYGFQMRRHGTASPQIIDRLKEANDKKAAETAAQEGQTATEEASQLTLPGMGGQTGGAGLAEKALPAVEGAVGADALLGEGGSVLAGLGGAVGAAAPYVGAALAGYKLWASQEAAARRLTGITGNTTLFGGVGGGSIAMKGQAIWGSLLNPGVDYTRAQEEALGTGAIGNQYNETRDFLLEASKRGLSDTVDMVDLYQESVAKAGGTTEQLVTSIDSMRTVASTTNASLSAMVTNFKANMEEFVNLGAAGGAANQAALIQSTAFAQYSPQAMMSPVLRNSGGYDVTNPYVQAQITANAGIPFNQLGTQSALNPQFAGNLPVKAENVISKSLTNYGFTANMTHDEIVKQFQDSGWGDYAGQILAAQGLLPKGVDPSDLPSVISSIQTVMGHPAAKAAADAAKAGNAVPLSQRSYVQDTSWISKAVGAAGNFASGNYGGAIAAAGPIPGTVPDVVNRSRGGSPSSSVTTSETPSHYVEDTLGAELTGGGIFGFNEHVNPWAGIAQQYEGWIKKTGNTSPIMDAVLKGSGHGAHTFVKAPDGTIMPLSTFMQQHPDWQQLLNNPKSQWRIATATPEDMTGISAARKTGNQAEVKSAESDLGFGTGAQIAAGAGDHPNATGPSPNSTGTVDLGAHTIQRLADAIAHAEDR